MRIEPTAEIGVEYGAGVAIVTLNRPDVLNAVDDALLDGLVATLRAAATDESSVVVLTGAGRAFCAGGDHGTLRSRAGDGALPSRDLELAVNGLLQALLDLEKPVVAAVNGPAIGLGATIALHCDYIVMSAEARIGDGHVRIGLVPGSDAAIWTALLGPLRAKEVLMSGRFIEAEEAAAMGLVNRVVPAGEVMAAAREHAALLAALPPYALRKTKASVTSVVRLLTSVVLPAGYAWEQLSMMTRDHQEALAAFREGRPGIFTGS